MAGRKLRAALTAIAIVLGVAMMSGAYVLTDTIERAFDEIFVDSYAGTDVVVSGTSADISFEGETSLAPPIPEAVLEQVRSVEGVEVATGAVQDFQTKLLTAEGEEIDTGGAPSLAFGLDTEPEYDRFNPLNLVEGRWASGVTRSSSTKASRTTRTCPLATASASPRSGRRGATGSSASPSTAT